MFKRVEGILKRKRKTEEADTVGKWDFTLDRDRVHTYTREVLIAAQQRTKELREARLARLAAAKSARLPWCR